MSIVGIPQEVKTEVTFRANDRCECRSPRHHNSFNERCEMPLFELVDNHNYVIINKNRLPSASNVRLICDFCLRHCYKPQVRRISHHRLH